jgi:general secretion pathway protein K
MVRPPEHIAAHTAAWRMRGMAVVSALFIVALIAALAAAMMGRQTAVIGATQGEQSRVQARWLLRGELDAVRLLLRSEAAREPTTRLDGLWRRPLARPVEGLLAAEGGARLVSEVTDEQGKYNLRNLVDRGRIDPIEAEVFARLCALLGAAQSPSGAIVRRVALSLGNDDHAGGDAPRLRALEDLLATAGVDAAVVAKLAPFVTVLPQRTWINANTASAELLSAGVPGLTLDRARELLAARDRGQWFVNTGDFASRLQMPQLEVLTLRIGVTSNWFRIASVLETPRTNFVQTALLRDDKSLPPRVVWLREGL